MSSLTQKVSKRSLRLGVDYGTSRSKLVLTDYDAVDGAFSFVVRPVCANGEFLIPSTVTVLGDQLYFGCAAEDRAKHASATVHRSLKMRSAYPEQFYGDPTVLPPGLSARDLATLYVGHLVALGQQIASTYASKFDAEAEIGITLGAPIAQLNDIGISRMFVGIAREAFELQSLVDLETRVSVEEGRIALGIVRDVLQGRSIAESRDWVRSEAEAALFWAYRSPAIREGRYACVDVGAGTTNASWLHISATQSEGIWVKERISFYGASCRPPACDSLNQVLWKHANSENDISETRGRENELADHLPIEGRTEYDKLLDKIGDVFIDASIKAYEKEKKFDRWRNRGQVFLHGGGTKLDLVRRRLLDARKEWLVEADPVAAPGLPSDLKEIDGSELQDDADFLLVAYGLARRLGDVVDAISPVDVCSFKPEVPLSNVPPHQVQYED